MELTAGVIAALVSIVLIALQCRDLWFFSDVWGVVTTRRLTSFEDLMRDHGGHWVLFQVLLIQGLYNLFGLDYWPWFLIPRLVGYAGVCFALWRTFRWQKMDPFLAFGAYLVLLFLGPSAVVTNVAHVGIIFIEGCLLGGAVLITRFEKPSAKHIWALFGLLTLALASGGNGAAVWGGVMVSLVLYRKIRSWWPAVASSLVIYVTWYVTYGTRQRAGPMKPSVPGLSAFLEAPGYAVQLLSASLESLLSLPEVLSTFVLGGLFIWILTRAFRKELSFLDTSFFLSALAFVALYVLIRVPAGVFNLGGPFYTFTIVFFFLPPTMIHLLRPIKERWRIPVFLVLILFTWFSALDLFRIIERRQQARQMTRPRVEAVGWMLAREEPFVTYAGIDYQIAARHVQRLIDEGWQVENPPDDEILVTMRGLIRMATNAPRLRGQPLKIQGSVQEGCTSVAPGEVFVGEVSGFGSIQLQQVSGVQLSLTWTDEFGMGERQVTAANDEMFIEFAKPKNLAQFSMSGTWQAPLTICGVEP